MAGSGVTDVFPGIGCGAVWHGGLAGPVSQGRFCEPVIVVSGCRISA